MPPVFLVRDRSEFQPRHLENWQSPLELGRLHAFPQRGLQGRRMAQQTETGVACFRRGFPLWRHGAQAIAAPRCATGSDRSTPGKLLDTVGPPPGNRCDVGRTQRDGGRHRN